MTFPASADPLPAPVSGKTRRDENFPVASSLIAARHRQPILAFYRFARAADDIADHQTLDPARKHALLDVMEATLLGRSDAHADALPLRLALGQHSMSPRHPLDLLVAFRADVSKNRYRDWPELIGYCRHSAMPVGRFVLDVHGESTLAWPASDALCAALQIINHVQDCGKDFRGLDRVYLPLDALDAAGAKIADISAAKASPQLRQCLHQMAVRTSALLDESAGFSPRILDFRLALEVAVIQRLARTLNDRLLRRDPLSEPVHLRKPHAALIAMLGLCDGIAGRLRRKVPRP